MRAADGIDFGAGVQVRTDTWDGHLFGVVAEHDHLQAFFHERVAEAGKHVQDALGTAVSAKSGDRVGEAVDRGACVNTCEVGSS